MSDRRKRSCEGKVRHGSEAAAENAAVRTPGMGGRVLMAYPCDFCGGWHVGGRSTEAGIPRRQARSLAVRLEAMVSQSRAGKLAAMGSRGQRSIT